MTVIAAQKQTIGDTNENTRYDFLDAPFLRMIVRQSWS